MNKLTITINDQLLDLDEDTKFQATYNGFNVFNPTKGLLSYTNAVSTPPTKRNLNIIDYQGPHSNSNIPYSTLKIKIFDDGSEIFAGVCYLGKVNKRINFVGITEGVTAFDLAKEIDLDEIDDTAFGSLSFLSFYPLRNGVNGLFAPLVDFGKLSNLPIVEFTDPTITSDTKWNQDTSPGGQVWNFATGNAVANINGNYTKQLITQETIFYAGYDYSFDLNFTLSSAISCTCTVYGYDDDNFPTQLATQNYVALGAKVLNVSFFPFRSYKSINIIFNGAAGAQVVTITSLTQPTVNAGTTVNLKFPFYYPMYAYKYILEKGLQQIGVPSINFNLSAAQSAFIDSLLMPYVHSGGEYSKKFIDDRTIQRRADGSQVMNIVAAATTTRVQFPIEVKMGYGSWATDTYTVPNVSYQYFVDVEVEMVINVTTSTGLGARFSVRYNGGGTLRGTGNVFGLGRKSVRFGNRIATSPLYGGFQMDSSTIEAIVSNVVSGGTLVFNVESAIINITPIRLPDTQPQNVLWRTMLLPEMPLFNLLKDYQIRTASLMRFNKFNELELKPIQNIIADKTNVVDWTSKRDRTIDDVEFSLPNYARSNVFENKEIDLLNDYTSLDLEGDGLSPKKTFFTSEFDSIQDSLIKGVSVAKIPVFDRDSEFIYKKLTNDYDLGAKEVMALVKYRASTVTDPDVDYGSGIAPTYTIAEPAFWKEFKSFFFTGFEESLDLTKVIDRVYNLTSQDVADLDNFKLMFDDNATYIIVSLKYIPGKQTKVTLFKTI